MHCDEAPCLEACPTLALKFLDEKEAKDLIAQSEVWKPEP
jgi:Fe-S-cluster-containing hydrogenase component 2